MLKAHDLNPYSFMVAFPLAIGLATLSFDLLFVVFDVDSLLKEVKMGYASSVIGAKCELFKVKKSQY